MAPRVGNFFSLKLLDGQMKINPVLEAVSVKNRCHVSGSRTNIGIDQNLSYDQIGIKPYNRKSIFLKAI